ncbi:MAG: hypothetical protein BGO01_07330 [Armatimonadetes bacterium 55-13]|nr:hypothetical protein [Armatimonadota bacterium]OJU62306.1 MAG: hypothetical protein BGO01_07330 [Armatimonadetes bacterium 55-13]
MANPFRTNKSVLAIALGVLLAVPAIGQEVSSSGPKNRWVGEMYSLLEGRGYLGTRLTIDRLYAAPTFAWGKTRTYWIPMETEGFFADGRLSLTDDLTLFAKGEYLLGIQRDFSSAQDKLTRLSVGLNYMFAPSASLDLGFENVGWDFNGAAKPRQTWYTFGFNFGLGSSTNLRLFWQVSDMNADGAPEFKINDKERARGGLIGTQLSVRF